MSTNIFTFYGSRLVNSSMFILKKSELPQISTRPISEDLIAKYALKKISDQINLHSSVIDLNNTTSAVFEENKQDKTEDDLRKSVLMSIIISTEFKWKKEIEVIQLRQYSEYLQKGLVENLIDVKPIDEKKLS